MGLILELSLRIGTIKLLILRTCPVRRIKNKLTKSIFLGDYIKWDPQKIYLIAKKNGFLKDKKGKNRFFNFADIDDDLISIHHYLKLYKFGFTRMHDNLSIEIRNNRISRK